MSDKTVINPGQPKFAINEITYSQIAAKKGYVEPLKVATIQFDPAARDHRYGFWRDMRRTVVNPEIKDFMPVTLLETELCTLCEALDIQIEVLQKELLDMSQKYEDNCGSVPDIQPNTPYPVPDKTKIRPPAPRFGIRDVVYLRETAEVVGRLEAFRVDDMIWDTASNMWLYYFYVRPRPSRNTTVGDRDDMRRSRTVIYPESQICTLCEALPLAVSFLENAITSAQFRKEAYCGSS
jgi:hypothetical protein